MDYNKVHGGMEVVASCQQPARFISLDFQIHPVLRARLKMRTEILVEAIGGMTSSDTQLQMITMTSSTPAHVYLLLQSFRVDVFGHILSNLCLRRIYSVYLWRRDI